MAAGKSEEVLGVTEADLRLDKHGLPLVPQPTTHKDDPLNWSPALKFAVLIQVSFLAFLGPMSSAVVNPAFVLLAKEFHITPVQASYQLTVYIICAGVGPLLVVPFSNIYGRRPIYLLGNLLAAVTNLVAGNSSTWAGILATRAFNGIGAGSPVALGAATICDMYFLHERGLYMGVYTFFLTNGPHVASLVGGFIAQNLGWRWCFTIPAYIQFAMVAITLFCLPETLYARTSPMSSDNRSYFSLRLFRRRIYNRKLHLSDFWKPFAMTRYISVLLPALYYMTCFGYGSVLFATTGSSIFTKLYGFSTAQTGLILSIPLLIGSLIGEANAGWFTDWLVYRHSKRNHGQRRPESRLDALFLALLLPVGTVLQGVCVSHVRTSSWVGNAFGMGIASCGLQVATTVTYAYCTDCYKPQSPEISALLNVFRQVFSALISFYAIPLAERIDYEFAWLVFALINLAFLAPMLVLRLYGERLRSRDWQAPPHFHNDI